MPTGGGQCARSTPAAAKATCACAPKNAGWTLRRLPLWRLPEPLRPERASPSRSGFTLSHPSQAARCLQALQRVSARLPCGFAPTWAFATNAVCEVLPARGIRRCRRMSGARVRSRRQGEGGGGGGQSGRLHPCGRITRATCAPCYCNPGLKRSSDGCCVRGEPLLFPQCDSSCN